MSEPMSHPTLQKAVKKDVTPIEILAEIWPEFDPTGQGIMADMMEAVLRRVETEYGSPLLIPSSWEGLREAIAMVQGTIVNQKDLGELLLLFQGPEQHQQLQEQQQQQQEQEQHREQQQPLMTKYEYQHGNNSSNNYYYHSHPHEPIGNVNDHDHDNVLDPYYVNQPPERVSNVDDYSNSPPQYQPQQAHHSQEGERDNAQQQERLHEQQQLEQHEDARQWRSSRGSTKSSSLPHSHSQQQHLLAPRPRPGIRKISLSESSPSLFRARRMVSQEVAAAAAPDSEDDDSDHHLSSGEDRELEIESVQHAYMSLQKKLQDTKLEYEARSNQHTKEDMLNQQQIDDLKRDLKIKRREISELKTNEQFKSSQIMALEQQIEERERTSSTQKTSVALLKMQRDELEEENARMQESLKIKEDALNDAMHRLTIIEAESRRINADQETMEELRQRLAAEITKNEAMACELELVTSEKMRLTELTGTLKSEVETLGGLAGSIGLEPSSMSSIQGKTLMSELEKAGAKFGEGVDLNEDDSKNAHAPSSFSNWNASHEGARRLLEESTSFSNNLKRSSMRDIGQRFKEGALEAHNQAGAGGRNSQQQQRQQQQRQQQQQQQQQNTQSQSVTAVAVTSITTDMADKANVKEVTDQAVVKHRVDDVDCALPVELQTLEMKEKLLDQALGTQAELIDDLFKTQELTQQIGVSFGEDDVIIGPAAMLGKRQQRERIRRRKLQPSRVLTPAEVVGLLNPGAEMTATMSSSPPDAEEAGSSRSNTSTRVLNKRENKKAIANVTLVSMYTIVVYLFGVITSMFFVDNGYAGVNYGRFLSFDALQDVAHVDMNGVGAPGRFKVVEILVYWLQNLVFQGDAGFVPT
ncbi:hypothetical protein BGZ94_000126 [Podila epigama]|nr:hypothetical protein BGZ94_000126 [Podila epigama]